MILRANMTGPNSPSGSNILTMIETIVRFVVFWARSTGWTELDESIGQSVPTDPQNVTEVPGLDRIREVLFLLIKIV